MSLIYEPTGKAREYAPLALNIYTGCSHACEYCYAPAALKQSRESFVIGKPRKTLDFRTLGKEALAMRQSRDQRQILLCFACDPYQEIDMTHRHTKRVLEIFHQNSLSCAVLTKGGKRSEVDFDIMRQFGRDQFIYGATLVFKSDSESLSKEPGAAPTSERINALKKAHDLGIKTWVSLEPVYRQEDAYWLIEHTKEFVDIFKVGKLNYRSEAKTVDWRGFARTVKSIMDSTGKEYLIKKDLAVLL